MSLLSHFIKNPDRPEDPETRRQYGTFAGVVGILANVLLFGAKFAVGTLAKSVAITADAFNNLSDAGSSAVTLFGFHLSAKPADKDHPFGHGRIEYISGMIVSFLILLVGYELFSDSITKIFHPEALRTDLWAVIVLGISIFGKLALGLFFRTIGKKIDSSSLKASMTDCISDAIGTAAVLVSVAVNLLSGYNIDAYVGILISIIVLLAGIKSLKEIADHLLGQPPTKEFTDAVRQKILAYEGIIGIHDLIVHNYGPNRCLVSLHAEVPADCDVLVCHDLIDTIEKEVGQEMGLSLVIHSDPIVINEQTTHWFRTTKALLREIHPSLTLHDFRMVPGNTHSNLIFDVLLPFDFPLSSEEIKRQLDEKLHALAPNYNTVITFDRSFV